MHHQDFLFDRFSTIINNLIELVFKWLVFAWFYLISNNIADLLESFIIWNLMLRIYLWKRCEYRWPYNFLILYSRPNLTLFWQINSDWLEEGVLLLSRLSSLNVVLKVILALLMPLWIDISLEIHWIQTSLFLTAVWFVPFHFILVYSKYLWISNYFYKIMKSCKLIILFKLFLKFYKIKNKNKLSVNCYFLL